MKEWKNEFRNKILLSASMTVKDLVVEPRAFDAVQL